MPATQPYHRPVIRPGRGGGEADCPFSAAATIALSCDEPPLCPRAAMVAEVESARAWITTMANWRTRSQRHRRWLRGLGRQSRRRSPRSCRKSKTILRHRSCCISPRHTRTSPSSRREQGPVSRHRGTSERPSLTFCADQSWSLAPAAASCALANARASATAPTGSGVCCRRDSSNPSPACRSRISTTRSRRRGKSSRLLLHRRQGSALRRSERVPHSPVPLAYGEAW